MKFFTGMPREIHPRWKGGKGKDSQGYIYVRIGKGNHPRANVKGEVPEHILVVEKVLGYLLPKGVIIHHVNGVKDDNRTKNLVVCPDVKYHNLVHARTRIVLIGGNPNFQKICCRCQILKSKECFGIHRSTWDGRQGMCKDCYHEYDKNRSIANKIAGGV